MKMKKLLKFMFWPLIMLKNILDANWWAEKIGNKTGAYENRIPKKYQGKEY